MMIMQILGLDPGRYRTSAGEGDDRAFVTLDSQIPDRERFKDCDQFLVRCRKCEGQLPFTPITDRNVRVAFNYILSLS
jgi:DNA polymerase alpha subunit A